MNICFIGGGNMATALIGGLLQRDFSAGQLHVVEINADNRTKLQQDFGVLATPDLASGIAGCELIVLAVKPQQLCDIAKQLAPILDKQLLVSIAAGIRAADLARWLGTQHIVRAMPNTPALIQSGITGLYALPAVGEIQRGQAQAILSAVGKTLWVQDEIMLDAVTAISGSGPAYVFYFIEALQEAASALGFDAEAARQLSIETFLGAARLAQESNDPVAGLRERVTSKGGTTEAALNSFDADQIKAAILRGAQAAAARGRELGEQMGKD